MKGIDFKGVARGFSKENRKSIKHLEKLVIKSNIDDPDETISEIVIFSPPN